MTKSCPAHRWEVCRVCGDLRPGTDLVSALDYRPGWKRGWICRAHLATLPPA